ncbi:MAG TPA: GNAT family N-acetyltransferase [Jiangellaceae bacterium]|nr:GNAT family N-acetyltransferase [Jiangellaceae bacterium]
MSAALPARTQADPGEFTVRALAYGDAVVRALEAELQQEYIERYGGVDESPVDPAQFAPPDGVFLVGFSGAEPVASGGFRRHDDEAAEIKRMYVVEDRRGIGYARRLLAELERRAAEAGYVRVVLETGLRQPEAVALYESSGYTPIPGVGFYAGQSLSRSFGKQLRLG